MPVPLIDGLALYPGDGHDVPVLIGPADDPRFCNVTFEWTQPESQPAPKDVLLRLQTITDKAFHGRQLEPFLMKPDGAGRWGATLRLRSDLRSTYGFFADHDGILRGQLLSDESWYATLRENVIADDTNPKRSPKAGNRPALSLLELPGAPPQPWITPRPGTAAGSVNRYDVSSPSLGNTRPVWLYDPAGAGPAAVMVLLDGDCWIDLGLPSILDNLIAANAIPPLGVIFVDCLDPATRRRELTSTGHTVFLRFLLEELMPWAHQHLRIPENPAHTIIGGQSFGGLTAAYAGLHAPGRFGNVLAQSGSFWWPKDPDFDLDTHELISQYVAAAPVPVRFYLEAGYAEWLLIDANRHMRDVLRAKGYDIMYSEFHGGHDWACWRGSIADGLIHLLNL